MLETISGLHIVGGWVRDTLLGLKPKDMDLASPLLPKEIISLCEKAGWTAKVTNHRHMVVTIFAPSGEEWEHTTFRVESEMDGVEATCTPTRNLVDDLNRRDFTINALALPWGAPLTEVVGVPGALEDLDRRVLRLVESPLYGTGRDRLEQSANRFFRAARFAAKGFTPDQKTLETLQGFAPDVLKFGNIEALQEEWSKTKWDWEFIENLALFGFLELKFPLLTNHPAVDPRVNLFFRLGQPDNFVGDFKFPNTVKRQIRDLVTAKNLKGKLVEWVLFKPSLLSKDVLADLLGVDWEEPVGLPTQAQVAAEGFQGKEIKVEWERRIRSLVK